MKSIFEEKFKKIRSQKIVVFSYPELVKIDYLNDIPFPMKPDLLHGVPVPRLHVPDFLDQIELQNEHDRKCSRKAHVDYKKFNKKPQKWVKLHGLIWMSFPIPRKGITLLEYRAIFSTSYLSVKITLRFRWQHTEDIYHLFRIVVAFSGYGLRFYA